jgi:hypothetical protein
MTRASLLVVVLASLAVGCGGSDTAPTPTPTPPPRPTFSATLLASNEVPPISNAESTASGSATITFDVTRDAANAITGGTATVVANLTGFPAGSTITVAHIHTGASGVAGGVLVPLIPAAGSVTLTTGAGSFTQTSPAMDGATATSIVNNAAGFYFNVHTALNPGGVVRGQLVRTQ